MLKGFKNFLMQGNLVIIAVGLVIALAFSTLVTAFTTTIITPLINALAGSSPNNHGLGWTIHGQRIALGSFISAVIYFIIFMIIIYFVLVVPYRRYMSKRGVSVFSTQAPPPPTKTCPECLSTDLPVAAKKCLHCASIVD
jgi:large conductance mechanosensitive channel